MFALHRVPTNYLNFLNTSPLVDDENAFRRAGIENAPLPSYAEAQKLLPEPSWPGHEDALACWHKVWELAFTKNLKKASPDNGFCANYIDTAFNGNLFMWDSVFILMFARYGARAFAFQKTLDNFYHRQRGDGFISRELYPYPGGEVFHPHDPSSTGPNVLAWSEWEHFLVHADRQRLAAVFPCLLAYHRWVRKYRTWQDGSYHSCGLACGMDNQPRVGEGYFGHTDHGHLSWIDATSQGLLSAQLLVKIAGVLGRADEVEAERGEVARLEKWMNERAWCPADGFYQDVHPEHGHSRVKSIAGFWPLLAGVVPPERVERLCAWLEDEKTFKRAHRVPSLAADARGYHGQRGDYWCGAVWPPTNYMLLRGLTGVGKDDLAYTIGRNHLDAVVEVFKQTGTVHENYAPDRMAPGEPAKADFVGWGGLGPVAVLLEYVFGLRPDVPAGRLVWDVRLTEEFGVRRYPFGREGMLELHCPARAKATERPAVRIVSNMAVTVELRWAGGRADIAVPAKS
ncbi:MAG: hypothetical protein IT443_04715 [Phycisphaeraceae bacterium]|nr:hypothetical protein [Phycisphaeraceae bacterium]